MAKGCDEMVDVQVNLEDKRANPGRRMSDYAACPDHRALEEKVDTGNAATVFSAKLMKWTVGLVTFLIFTVIGGIGGVAYFAGILSEQMTAFTLYASEHRLESAKGFTQIQNNNAVNVEQQFLILKNRETSLENKDQIEKIWVEIRK